MNLVERLRADRFEYNGDLDLEAADRIEQLEAVLRECCETLVHCEGALDEVRGYPITYDMTIETIAKIEKILK